MLGERHISRVKNFGRRRTLWERECVFPSTLCPSPSSSDESWFPNFSSKSVFFKCTRGTIKFHATRTCLQPGILVVIIQAGILVHPHDTDTAAPRSAACLRSFLPIISINQIHIIIILPTTLCSLIGASSDHEKPYKRYDHGTCTSTGALGRRDPALRTLVTLHPEEASPLKG